MKKPKSSEIFVGGGGNLLGVEAAGFENILAIDNDQVPLNVLKRYRPEVPTLCASVLDLTASQLLTLMGLAKGELEHFAASWPCQQNSSQNNKAQKEPDPAMAECLNAFVDLVIGTKPMIVTGENVFGAVRENRIPILDAGVKRLRAAGYEVLYFTANCSTFGVPQLRPRMFLMAKRNDLKGTLTVPPGDDTPFKHLTIGHNFPGVRAAYLENYGEKFKSRNYDVLPTVQCSEQITFLKNGERVSLTIEELLKAQTFPADYIDAINAEGLSYARAYKLIGNAVPPRAAQQVVSHLWNSVNVSS